MSDAATIHSKAIVWDQTFPATPTCGSWAAHHAALERMRASGYTVVSITVASDPDDTLSALRRIGQWRRFVAQHPERFRLLLSANDVGAAKSAGQLALGFHFQGTTPFDRDIGLVEVFYKLGVRHALMAYNQKNHVGDGCHERTDAGLSRFGLEVVQEMQRLGMLVDCTHTGRRTSLDVFEVATAPVIYSHSNAAALKTHQRNIEDELALACAKTGGVIGINGIGIFLGANDTRSERVVDHIAYVAELVGTEHVGLGIDYSFDDEEFQEFVRNNPHVFPTGDFEFTGFAEPEQTPEIARLLGERGFSETEVAAILGGNFLRVASQVWR